MDIVDAVMMTDSFGSNLTTSQVLSSNPDNVQTLSPTNTQPFADNSLPKQSNPAAESLMKTRRQISSNLSYVPFRPPAYKLAFLNLRRSPQSRIKRPTSEEASRKKTRVTKIELTDTRRCSSAMAQSEADTLDRTWNWGLMSTDDFSDEELEDDDIVKSASIIGQSVSQTTYRAACRRFNLLPSKVISDGLNRKELKVTNHVVLSDDAKALSIALVKNSTVTILHLQSNNLDLNGTAHIVSMLKDNTYITDLTLAENNLGVDGAKLVSLALRSNFTIEILNLSGNSFADNAATHIAELIKRNTVITELVLSHNEFREDGGKVLAGAIASNRTMTSLDLSWNHLRRQGAVAISRALMVNVYLEEVNLSWNGWAMEGCKALILSLRKNKSIRTLDLSCNRIDILCLMELLKGLKDNTTITNLSLAENPITVSGANALIRIIYAYETVAVEHLDLSGQCIDQEFVNIVDTMKQQRRPSFVCRHDFVLREHLIPADVGDDFVGDDPMIVLMEFMRLQNLRLVDLFKKFDTDGSDTLTHREFRDGLRSVNIPLNRYSLDELIKKLDADGDGEVNFVELVNGQKEHKKRMAKLQRKSKNKPFSETQVGKVTVKLQYLMSIRERKNDEIPKNIAKEDFSKRLASAKSSGKSTTSRHSSIFR